MERTLTCSEVETRSLVDDGDHRREAIGSERPVGSFTTLIVRRVSVDRMLMTVDASVAINFPSGLGTQCGEAIGLRLVVSCGSCNDGEGNKHDKWKMEAMPGKQQKGQRTFEYVR